MSTDAAVKANATRKADADVVTLRRHFDGEGKSEDRAAIADFLVKWTPDEQALEIAEPGDAVGARVAAPLRGFVGDLQGGGLSSKMFASRGLPVLAAENCSWTRTKLGNDRGRAQAAAVRMAEKDGYGVVIGDFLDVIPRLSTANYDPCAIPTGCVRDVIRAMVDAQLVAFAVTVVLSRIPGMKGRDSDFYDLGTDALMAKDAHGYHLVDKRRYAGTANVPMATYFFVRGRAYTIYEEHRAEYLYTALDAGTPEFEQRMASFAVAEYLWKREKESWLAANPGHVLWCRCRTMADGKRSMDIRCLTPDQRRLIEAMNAANRTMEEARALENLPAGARLPSLRIAMHDAGGWGSRAYDTYWAEVARVRGVAA